MTTWAKVLMVLLLLFGGGVLRGQTTATTQDTDFWVGFIDNIAEYFDNMPPDTLALLVSGSTPTTGIATCGTMSVDFSVSPGTMTRVVLPPDFPVATHGVHVATAAPVSLYASNYHKKSHDITGVLPTSALWVDYVLQSFQDTLTSRLPTYNEFCVVATQDSTTVYYQIGESPSTMPDSVLLRAGQLFQWVDSVPLSGTHVWTADCGKPIAVFMGHGCACVPYNEGACDQLYEQAVPTCYWGRNFVVTSSLQRGHDIVRVTALYDSTTFTFGDTVQRLGARQTAEFDILSETTPATFLQSDKPVCVVLYLTGNCYDNPYPYWNMGDPSTVVIHPVERQVRQAAFTTYPYAYSTGTIISMAYHNVNITIDSSSIGDIALDGAPIGHLFTSVPNRPEYAYARLNLEMGSHTLSSQHGGFVAHTYGVSSEQSYAYALGTSFALNSQFRIADSASAYLDSTGSNYCPGDTLHFRVTVDDESSTSVAWDFGDGRTATGVHAEVAYPTPGDYLVTAVVTSFKSCLPLQVDTFSQPVHIIPVSYGVTDTVVCGDSCVWHGNAYADTGLYAYHRIESLGHCGLMELHILNIYPRPEIAIEESRDCDSRRILLTAHSSGDIYAWSSDPIDPGLSGHEHDTAISISPREGQAYTFWTAYSYDSLCSATDTFQNHDLPFVKAHALAEPLIADADGAPITLTDLSTGASARCWYVDGAELSTDSVTYFNYDGSRDSVSVMLVASDDFGCRDTDFVTLRSQLVALWAPNVFTPTQSAHPNSRFRLYGCNIMRFEIWIFNRQGALVWHSTDFNEEWDGTCYGRPCEQGAYAYTAVYSTSFDPASQKRLIGTVTLLR